MLDQIYHQLKSFFGNNFQVFSAIPLTGGDINAVYKIESSAGTFCIKINDAGSYPRMLQREFEGLNLLRKNSDFRIPEPLYYNEIGGKSYLIMEFISSGNKVEDFWQSFGHSLAAMHNQSAEYFGLSSNNFIGSLTQDNAKTSNWCDFYAEHRILDQAKRAYDANLVDDSFIAKAQQLCGKLESIIPVEKPALLHGDLWSGNYMIDDKGTPVLIDPAVYYGHREIDLAMTKLFGGFHPDMYEAYNEVFPLESKWEDRIALFQLYPILVHVNLFGGSYVQQASHIVQKYL